MTSVALDNSIGSLSPPSSWDYVLGFITKMARTLTYHTDWSRKKSLFCNSYKKPNPVRINYLYGWVDVVVGPY